MEALEIETNFPGAIIEIAKNEDIKNPKLTLREKTKKGEGYCSIIKHMKMEGTNNKVLGLVFKYVTLNEKLVDKTHPNACFVQEINFYEKVYKVLQQFQNEYGVKRCFDNVPKCYYTSVEPKREILVFEDLKAIGYAVWKSKTLMDEEHVKITIKCYAKFHATSMAFKILKPEEFRSLVEILNGNNSKKDTFAEGLDSKKFPYKLAALTKEFIDLFDENLERKYFERIKSYAENLPEHYDEVMNKQEEMVISQGDCWCCNMIFQYASAEDASVNSKPINIKLLDFQTAFPRPPVLDLAYFIYVGTPEEILNDLDSYLLLYHATLSEHLKQFNLNADEVFSYKKWIELWKKYAKYGLMWGILLRREMLGELANEPDLYEPIEDDEVIEFDAFAIKNVDEEEYKRQFKYLVKHFVDRGFI